MINRLLSPDIMVFMIPIVAIIGGCCISALKILKGSDKGGESTSAEDVQLIQEIHHGLQRMEDRIGALETIVLEQERARGKAEEE